MKNMRSWASPMSVVLALGIVIALHAQAADTHTPNDFLFDRQSRLVMEYVEAVMKRGDASDLLAGIHKVHSEIKAGQHSGNLDVIRVNLLTTIGTAETFIQEQEYPDKVDPEQFAATEAQELEQWRQDVLKVMPDASPRQDELVAFPDTREIYNERKKDLLEESYEMLETIQAKMQ